MEEAAELGNYLPRAFKTKSEQDYIAFLWDAFETNYTHGKHQFAFLSYHMLTMSFVYFNIWQIKQSEPGDFAKGLIGVGKDEENKALRRKAELLETRLKKTEMIADLQKQLASSLGLTVDLPGVTASPSKRKSR